MTKELYCKKEFLTPEDEPSTSTVVSFFGDVKWHKNSDPENLSFLEISSCHEKARLHRTADMTEGEWLLQMVKLMDHIYKYVNFLKERLSTYDKGKD